MQIAIVSDTHSRYETVEKVLAVLKERKINFIIHCGDIEDADTIWLFHGFTTHFVYGNCDIDRTAMQQAIHGIGETLHRPYGKLELDGVKIAFLHGDDKRLMAEVENSGEFDFLFFGHTHLASESCTGLTRVINPGALHRARPKSFAILDLPNGQLERVEVE